MLASTERAPSPLSSALLADKLGPVVMADDPCEAAFGSATPTGPRKYYRARYYEPKIGRFLREDPIEVAAREVRELNPYSYVANNPVNETDPFGLAIWVCNRKAFSRWGPGNHSYYWDDRNGACCGRGSTKTCKEKGPPTDDCRKVEESDGREDEILGCCSATADQGVWIPGQNDCHTSVDKCLDAKGLKNPGIPGGRFGPPCDPCKK